jgi:vancomycin permeability regulator SanA
MKNMLIIFIKTLMVILGVGLLSAASARILVVTLSNRYILSQASQPEAQVALVFGAGLRRDGSPTAILRDRVQSAVELYRSGKVSKLLMSGDNRFIEYNEPGAMREYALSLGVPDKDIVLDFAGRRTYDSCYRAKYIFGIRSAILVTQPFHLPRALYTCHSMGIEVTGFAAENIRYRKISELYWNIREIPAMLVSVIEVKFTHPLPVLGEQEYIFPEN